MKFGSISREKAAAPRLPPEQLKLSIAVFGSWQTTPMPDAAAIGILRTGLRAFPVDGYIIVHRVEKDKTGDQLVVILHVVHSSRDLLAVIQEGTA